MSFSFTVRAATTALALAAVAVELDKVVAAQPAHAHDAEAVKETAARYASLLSEDAEKDVVIACNGWAEWQGTDAEPHFVGVNVGVNVRHLARE